MFRWIRKRRAIKAYQRQLGPWLRATHGQRRHYTPAEVNWAIRNGRFSDEFHGYALSMYCDALTFDAYHRAQGVACDYGAMRAECEVSSFQGADFVDSGHFGGNSVDVSGGGASGWFDFSGSGWGGYSGGGDSGGGGSDCGGGGGGGDSGGGGSCGGD
jgi:hypothetical protein